MSGKSSRGKIEQQHVRVGSATDQLDTMFCQRLAKRACIIDHLFAIIFEFIAQRFAQAHGLGCDDLAVQTALHPGKYGGLQLFCPIRVT